MLRIRQVIGLNSSTVTPTFAAPTAFKNASFSNPFSSTFASEAPGDRLFNPVPAGGRTDFCHAVRSLYDVLSHVSVTHGRSPVISSTTFHARPPDLPPTPLMDMGFVNAGLLARHRRPRIHRPACLLHASFRPRLAVTPLRFARPSTPSRWSEDFHLQAVEHARRTSKGPATRRPRQNPDSQLLLRGCDRVFHGLGDAELHHGLGGNLDRFAGLRIATDACLAV